MILLTASNSEMGDSSRVCYVPEAGQTQVLAMHEEGSVVGPSGSPGSLGGPEIKFT